jgi:hypothetical protein
MHEATVLAPDPRFGARLVEGTGRVLWLWTQWGDMTWLMSDMVHIADLRIELPAEDPGPHDLTEVESWYSGGWLRQTEDVRGELTVLEVRDEDVLIEADVRVADRRGVVYHFAGKAHVQRGWGPKCEALP